MDTQEKLKTYKDVNMKLGEDLDDQYQKWQEKIESGDVDDRDIEIVENARYYWFNRLKTHRDNINKLLKTGEEEVKREVNLLLKELDNFTAKMIITCRRFINFVRKIMEGLSLQRIQHFEQFTADETFVGDKCAICIGDIEIGRNMMRLDCDGQHTFCQVCIERWFANHKTCPICRHRF